MSSFKLSLEQKSVPSLSPILVMVAVAINLHTTIIQVHVGRNLVDDVLLNEGSGAKMIIEDLKK
jgi:hypothetical protein